MPHVRGRSSSCIPVRQYTFQLLIIRPNLSLRMEACLNSDMAALPTVGFLTKLSILADTATPNRSLEYAQLFIKFVGLCAGRESFNLCEAIVCDGDDGNAAGIKAGQLVEFFIQSLLRRQFRNLVAHHERAQLKHLALLNPPQPTTFFPLQGPAARGQKKRKWRRRKSKSSSTETGPTPEQPWVEIKKLCCMPDQVCPFCQTRETTESEDELEWNASQGS